MTSKILLIGMAGAGKSFLGKRLAQHLSVPFIDGDDVIREKFGDLQTIIDEEGDAQFLKKEAEALYSLSPTNSVLSPGGSVVLNDALMNTLKQDYDVLFLDTSYDIIYNRLKDQLENRGIVGMGKRSLKEVYDQRMPLCKQYADITLSISSNNTVNNYLRMIQKVNQYLNNSVNQL